MKLDKRIKDNRIGDCFTTEEFTQYLTQPCYFANSIDKFKDLKSCEYANLVLIAQDRASAYYTALNDADSWKFCLPCEYVEEDLEGFRPLTIEDFEDNEPLDEWVRMRRKADGNVYNLRFNGYFTFAGDCCICLGSFYYKSKDLFDLYELYRDGKYVVFGVEK